MSDRPEISATLIVTVLNDREGVRRLIGALKRQSRAPDEIIVVDGGSTDGTRELLNSVRFDRSSVRCVVERGVNIAAGRNRAIVLASHDVIVCTDAGCEPDPRWFERIVAPFEDPDISVVGGGYRIDAATRLERVVGLLTMPGQLQPVDPVVFNPSARSMAFRRRAWQRAGGFPEWLYTAEDTLFDCKLRRNGECFAFASRAVVRWRPRDTWRAIWKQFRDYARGEQRIGRGSQSAAHWFRRYAGVTIVALFALILVAIGAPVWSVITTLLCAGALLLSPVYRRAQRVGRASGRLSDVLCAIAVHHWVALASLRGFVLGRRDRRRHPGVYIDQLRSYWGDDSVCDVPPWRMKYVVPPRTLIVSWHWAPTHRASATVLSTLFRAADPRFFRVITRDMPQSIPQECIECPDLATDRIYWPQYDDQMRGIRTLLASLWTAARMLAAVRYRHRRWGVQRILAVYPHRWSLLVGLIASRWLNVPLIAYMHDLFAETLSARQAVRSWFWRRVDRAVLSAAELVIVPTREFADHYGGRGVNRTWVLPHCVPRDAPAEPGGERGCGLQLLYAGSTYEAHLSALRVFARAVERLKDVDAVYLTNPNGVLLDDRVAWLPRADTQARMRSADVLVVLLAEDSPYPDEIRGCFPSKLVDYLAAEKSVLAVVPDGCFVARFVRDTGCGIAVTPSGEADIAEAVDRWREPGLRAQMSAAAREAARTLDPATWCARLARRLTGSDHADHENPAREPIDNSGGRVQRPDTLRQECAA